jgi:hypothetical protein
LIVLLTTLAVIAGMAVPVSAEKPHNEKQSILFVAAWPEGEWAEDNVVFVADGDRQEAGADFSIIDDGCVRSISSDGDFESAELVVSPLVGKDRFMNAEGTVEGLRVEVEYEDCSDEDFSWEGRVDLTFHSEGFGKPWRHHAMEDWVHIPGEMNYHRLTRWTQRAANTWVTIDFPDAMDDWNIGLLDSVISAESNSIHENNK